MTAVAPPGTPGNVPGGPGGFPPAAGGYVLQSVLVSSLYSMMLEPIYYVARLSMTPLDDGGGAGEFESWPRARPSRIEIWREIRILAW